MLADKGCSYCDHEQAWGVRQGSACVGHYTSRLCCSSSGYGSCEHVVERVLDMPGSESCTMHAACKSSNTACSHG